MTDRVKQLREESFRAEPELSIERALIETAFYKENLGKYSEPMMRALNFLEICKKKTVYIGKNELIVGERGPKPKAVSTFPELTCHSVEDLHVLNTRELQPYKISQEDIDTYAREVIPYWKGRTLRERIFAHVPESWRRLYHAGLFTEFMEQRAPGHTALDGKIYRMGMRDFQAKIAKALNALDFVNDPMATDKREELLAMDISCQAVILLAHRYAEEADRQAAQLQAQAAAAEAAAEADADAAAEAAPTTAATPTPSATTKTKATATALTARANELRHIAHVCRRVPEFAPQTYHEAIQMYWFIHLATITELNGWDAMNPGHFDQHLAPFYEQDLKAGRLTRQQALELMECFFIKVNNQTAPPKVGITAKESGTYNDFTNLNIGGITTDGQCAVSEVSYIMLEAISEIHLLQPGTSIHLSKATSPHFLKEACKVIRKGYGYPSVFNCDTYVQELVNQGKSLADAREGGCSGCIEVGAFGKEAYLLTGYLNVAKILEITLHNGFDPVSGQTVSLATGAPETFTTFEQLYDAFLQQVQYIVNQKVPVSNYIDRMFAKYAPATLLSVVIDDCIEKGRDYYNGGARYNTNYIQCTGLGSITDSLCALQKHVYQDKRYTLTEVIHALEANFEGHEKMRQILLRHTPCFGNDNPVADAMAVRIYNDLYRAIEGHPNTRGECFHLNMLSTTCHVYFGTVTGALPNGRFAGKALSDGTSPSHGADVHGPGAVVKSLGKLDQTLSGGTLLNQRFSPSLLKSDEDLDNLAALIRSYFAMGGHHIQFNVVDTATLRAAQQHPEDYRDLLVRVAGYSDYFNHMDAALQEDVISRTENACF